MKNYNTSPLPFQGQKRNFVKAFKQALNDCPTEGLYVDLFGGSGLLSHSVKSVHPESTVVYNDYDGFVGRIKAIPATNELLSELRTALIDVPRKATITGTHRETVNELLKKAASEGFADWITISSNLLFSMNYATTLDALLKETMYNKVRLSDYDAAGYLEGVSVVSCDYKQLFLQYSNKANVVFLVDPPYLSTDTSSYNSSHWKLKDYLDVLHVISNNNYFYFTSNKSQIVELCEWISSVSATANPFNNATITTVNVSASYNSGYTDIMYHYKHSNE